MEISNSTKALIFDFGNVIIDIDFERTFQKFKEYLGTDYEKFARYWKESNFHRDIETKKYTARQMSKELHASGFRLTADQVQSAWNALLLELPEERIHLLRSLSTQFPLYLLSNTNHVHIDRIFGDLEVKYGHNPLKPLFRKMFLSYKLASVKPEKAIYESVLSDIPYKSSECLFFDDTVENLKGAEKLGFQTQHVTKENGIMALLDHYHQG